ncbi:MAG: deoxyguanosinetriphosphate triphosphohydrolase [Candidatus Aminicenantes bacterium]
MSIRERIETLEKETLHEKACLSSESRGRERSEKFHSIRTAFQRDRDRIIHCKSFRRLKHKTQVFMAPFGDHYRTRLTHTLEVSQIARTIAKALRLNEDLTEAIALGHDLGHTPFGHAGENTLDSLLSTGFTHSRQSLRVVEQLEYEGKGLNLTYEVRDGIFKHSKGKGAILSDNEEDMPVTLEGQIVRASDVIAYVNHDIDDAVRAGVIKATDIPGHLVDVFGKWPALRIDRMVKDVVESSLEVGLARIGMSEAIAEGITELRQFLYERVYFNPAASAELRKTEKIMEDLFAYLMESPGDLVKAYPEGDSLERRVGDAIAGMTDLYALRLYEKFFFPRSWPVL